MKYLVISDIHGSESGAAIIKEALQIQKADKILALGDFLYHGPRNALPKDYDVKTVIDILNGYSNSIIAVRGNCDAEVDQMVLQFPLTADYNEFFTAAHKVFMTHGHVYSKDHMPSLQENDCFLYGHTHIPETQKLKGVYMLNPGSVSIPKGGHPATYATMDDKNFTVYTLDHREYMHIDLK